MERLEKIGKESVSMETYALNPRRYGNAIVEKVEGLPSFVKDLDEVSLRHIMNYIDKNECQWTGKTTYLNKVVSFLNSGAYSDKYLERVFGFSWKPKSVKTKSGSSDNLGNYNDREEELEKRYFIRDKVEYAKIEIDAIQNWENKKLSVYFDEYITTKHGKLTKELIEQEILIGLREAQDDNTKLKYIKTATDILGMNKGSNNLTQVNVYSDGGGRGLSKEIVRTSGNDNFDIGVDD